MGVGTSIIEWEITENSLPDYSKPVLLTDGVNVTEGRLIIGDFALPDIWRIPSGLINPNSVIAWAEMPAPYKPEE